MTTEKGIGAFADEFIPANTMLFIITYESKYYDEQEAIAHLSTLATDNEKRHWLTHVYEVKEKLAEDPHDLLMITHSDNPNYYVSSY